VLYVHGGSIDPAWSLGLCLLAITVPRLVLYRRGVVDVGAAREKPAA
jgi:hypothetical protein